VSSLLVDSPPPAAPAVAEAPEPPAPAPRACETCGAPLLEGQYWCLECGTGAPGRLGVRAGWRVAALVVGITLLLASGALAASYAALSSDSKRAVTNPGAQASLPATTSPPAAPPAGPTPTSPATVTPPPVKPTATPATPAPATPSTSTPSTSTPSTSTPSTSTPSTSTPSTSTPSTPSRPKPVIPRHLIVLDTDAASTYNPGGLPDSNFGDPSATIDGDSSTSWTAKTASPGCKVGAGVGLDLKSAQSVKQLNLATDTPDMDAEIYGAKSGQPASLPASGWVHLASRPRVKSNARIGLAKANKRFRHLLVWIPHGPAGKCPTHVSVNEISLQG